MACEDYGLAKFKDGLTEICKRATPDEWAKFGTSLKVTKIIRDEQFKPLIHFQLKTLFVEQRKWGFGKFFDGSKMTKGHQSLQNRLACLKEMAGSRTKELMEESFFNYLKI